MTTSPAHKIRIGNVSVIVWRNPSEKGAWYSLQITRSYKNGDDEWRNTDALGYDDILTAAKLLDLGHTWVTHQLETDRKGRKESQQAA